MKQIKEVIWLIIIASLLAACGVADKDDEENVQSALVNGNIAVYESSGFERSPFEIEYEIIGTPIIDQQVAIQLRLISTLESRPIHLEFKINDSSSMTFADAQPQKVYLEPAASGNTLLQRVLIIPQKMGRIFLNVTASIKDTDGKMSMIIAIPVIVEQTSISSTESSEIQVTENPEKNMNF